MLIDRIKENYAFKDWDEKALNKLAPTMDKHGDDFIEAFYKKAMTFKNATKYLKDENVIKKHKSAIKAWFEMLFKGPYDDDYLSYLEGIGYTHVKVGLPSHYINVSVTHIREYCSGIILKEVSASEGRDDMIVALGKILDINLDILTSSYIKEEKNIFFVSKKAESKLINFAMRFSHGLNLILIMGLVLLGLMVLGLFGYDIVHIFYGGDLEKGLLATLGSLLMLWVVIELVDTEVDHLRGAKFSVKVFVSVAMVAIIRKILVTSLKTEAIEAQYSLIAALAVLGLLWWIISKTEKQ
ncbi:MAG: phosphate-starvation-inducible PsiE family protein [Proteobacteria bacterium]|nr:phosphate-starvation-inducible PsiE family protein [Pseudomonadota bacterium]